MGQLVNQTSFQFNGTVVDTLSVDMVNLLFEVFGLSLTGAAVMACCLEARPDRLVDSII
jgi:hypothetical protein